MSRLLPALGPASAAAVVIAAVLVFNLGLTSGPGSSPTPAPSQPSIPPSAGPVACGALPANAGTVLDCSSDGTILLIQKADKNLVVRHADGSETQVAAQTSGILGPLGAYPAGATISSDGSRVVFAGVTKSLKDATFCHDGALFGVAAAGGPAEVLWASHVPENGLVMYPSFSPDGTQIAFADGYCDYGYSIWLMNADGSNAHEILPIDARLGAGHLRGLAWSPAGDRIAVQYDAADVPQALWTFAPDGSSFKADGDVSWFCWPGQRC